MATRPKNILELARDFSKKKLSDDELLILEQKILAKTQAIKDAKAQQLREQKQQEQEKKKQAEEEEYQKVLKDVNKLLNSKEYKKKIADLNKIQHLTKEVNIDYKITKKYESHEVEHNLNPDGYYEENIQEALDEIILDRMLDNPDETETINIQLKVDCDYDSTNGYGSDRFSNVKVVLLNVPMKNKTQNKLLGRHIKTYMDGWCNEKFIALFPEIDNKGSMCDARDDLIKEISDKFEIENSEVEWRIHDYINDKVYSND